MKNFCTPTFFTCGRLTLGYACLAASSFAQTKPNPVPSGASKVDEPVELSPFVVQSGSEQGYLATQTLNGTRFNTPLRDVAASMTIFTEEMMNDLAASSINDVLAFAPNTDSFANRTDSADNSGNDFLNNAVQYITRGGTTNIVGQDFFPNGVPPDNYDTEAFTFTRGPNAILFGLGNPAGAFVSSSKRAKTKDAYGVEYRTDSNGSVRTSVDVNRVVIKNRLALRYAGLYEESEGFRKPSDGFQRRTFLTATYTPFEKSSIRINYEKGRHEAMAIRPWPVYDGISAWIAAGKPLLNNVGAALPTGITRSGYTANLMVSTQYSPAGTILPTVNYLNQGRTIDLAYPNFPNEGNNVSLNNPSLFPVNANTIGAGSSRKQDFTNYSLFIDQQVGRNLFIEAAINKSTTNLVALNSFVGNYNILRVDVNKQLPNGQPNPNVGMYYVETLSSGLIHAPGRSVSERVMVSYDLDLSRKGGWWGNLLGRHRMAAFYEYDDSTAYNSNNGAFNVTPLAGFPADITNTQNRPSFRFYLDPSKGIVSGGVDTSHLPAVYANSPLPTSKDASGLTLAYLQTAGGIAQLTDLWTRAIALQSQFLQGRLVLTNGLRQDQRALYRAQTTDFLPFRDARLIYPDPTLFDAKRDFLKSRQDSAGQTFTHGAVFHALSWLSLTFNKSTNFQPSSNRNVSGDLLPNPTGDGRDYGLRFNFLDDRIVADVTYYENFRKNQPDNTISTASSAGNFKGSIDPLWQTIGAAENKPEYLSFPYSDSSSTWQDALTTKAQGYEASVTTNLSPSWQFTVNGSKRSKGETIERAPFLKAYLAHWIPIWKSNAQWMSYSGPPGSSNVTTVANRVASLETNLKNLNALASVPDDAFSAAWSTNLVTNYSFAREGWLRGFSIGGSMNMRGRSIAGFAEDASNVIIPTKPYYVGGYKTVGTWLTYQRKLFSNKVAWRLQLNVRNLFDEHDIAPLHIVDKRNGTGQGSVESVVLSAPRTYVLTSSFKF